MISQSNIRETEILNTSADSTVHEGVLGLLAVDEFNYVIPNITFDAGEGYTGAKVTISNAGKSISAYSGANGGAGVPDVPKTGET